MGSVAVKWTILGALLVASLHSGVTAGPAGAEQGERSQPTLVPEVGTAGSEVTLHANGHPQITPRAKILWNYGTTTQIDRPTTVETAPNGMLLISFSVPTDASPGLYEVVATDPAMVPDPQIVCIRAPCGDGILLSFTVTQAATGRGAE
jgi:hypothetical protein